MVLGLLIRGLSRGGARGAGRGGRAARGGRGGRGGRRPDLNEEQQAQLEDAFDEFLEARDEHNENAVLQSFDEMQSEAANEGQSMILEEGAEGYAHHALHALNAGKFSPPGPEELGIDEDKYRATEEIWEIGTNFLESVGKFPMEIGDFLE